MFEYISGKFTQKTPAYVVVDVSGLGYIVQVSLNTYTDISNEIEGSLLTHYSVSVDVR